MYTPYVKLPLVNPEAQKIESRRVSKAPSEGSIKQDNEDAKKIMSVVKMDGHVVPNQ